MKRLRLFFASIVVVLAFIGLVACGSKNVTYTVNFETNGGTNVNPITDTKIQYEPLTLKDNFIFDGWYDVEDFSTDRITFPYEIKANVTFYAKWKTAQVDKETYTVTFRTNGGLPVASVKTDVIEQAPVTSLENHIFMGWYLDSDFKTKVEFPYQVTKDITLYAYLKPIEQNVTYTVKFNTDGGTAVEDFVGTIIELSPVTTKENADFKGWYEEAEFKNKVDFPYELLDNCTLYAKWEPKKQGTSDDVTELTGYLSKDIKSYQEVYGLDVSNDNGSVFKGSSTYTVNGKNLTRLAPNITDQGIEVDASGNVILYRDYLFYRESEEKYYAYFQDLTGTIEGKDGRFYLVTETEDPYDEY
ncbi:MAG: InlB B-repeat-containing protein, partial [Anaeroplasmataceae bacterium]|nr:InlB B-repeat-containing protein [Anaeroplasmataceae bacterium]